mmetsp:Transcript_6186/g.18714  ORF Transcript_6186/g.18714 Transcript_6186/m.18714 type:complete len:343 (-) Transcript_6186:259-1287(-)
MPQSTARTVLRVAVVGAVFRVSTAFVCHEAGVGAVASSFETRSTVRRRVGSGRSVLQCSMLRNRELGKKSSAGRYLNWLEESSRATTQPTSVDPQIIFGLAAAGLLIAAAVLSNQWSNELTYVASAWRAIQSLDVGTLLADVSDRVDSLGPLGMLYFSAVYVVAEVLALPAVPLTASAGYLFGAITGTAVVLVSATIAAGLSFLIGRFLLRGWVESVAAESPQFRAIDKAVQREGFKIVLLLRLSPIFPFALSNYFYGLTAVDFWPYLLATLLGFAPGTALYVYGGEVASIVQESAAAADASAAPFPWYVYAGFLAAGVALASKVTDIASSALKDSDSFEDF